MALAGERVPLTAVPGTSGAACDKSSSRNEYAPVAVPAADTVKVYAPAGRDSAGLPESAELSEEVKGRLLTGVPFGPASDHRRLPLFVSASKYNSAGAARVNVYLSCCPDVVSDPLVAVPRTSAVPVGGAGGVFPWNYTFRV